MAPTKEPVAALAAPGIGGPNSILNTPWSGPRSVRRHRNRSFSHVHLELDLAGTAPDPVGDPILERLASFLRERKIVEKGTLILLAGESLHALAARGFRRVDHWEVSPGGWLPPPSAGVAPDDDEPVGHLVHALERDPAASVGSARSFAARVSDYSGARVDLVVRRVHRERRHSMTLDLWGLWTATAIQELVSSITSRLPVVRSAITKYQYAPDRKG